MTEEDLRKNLIKGVIDEIRGPRFGYDEIISYDPWDEYLIGTIIPIKWKRKKSSPNNEITNESDYKYLLSLYRQDDYIQNNEFDFLINQFEL